MMKLLLPGDDASTSMQAKFPTAEDNNHTAPREHEGLLGQATTLDIFKRPGHLPAILWLFNTVVGNKNAAANYDLNSKASKNPLKNKHGPRAMPPTWANTRSTNYG